MVTMKKGERVVKVRDDKTIIDAFLQSGFELVKEEPVVQPKKKAKGDSEK